MDTMAEKVRLRLVFEERRALRRSQRAEGLQCCWILLRPEIETVSDLAAHITRSFALRRMRANDLLLSMDDFVLPPFESTGIFNDKDIIRVRKKDDKCMGNIVESSNDANLVEDLQCIENESDLLCCKHPLAGESKRKVKSCCNKKKQAAVDHLLELNNLISSSCRSPFPKTERKQPDELEKSMLRKRKASNPENHAVPFVEATETIQIGRTEPSSQKERIVERSLNRKGKPPEGVRETDTVVESDINGIDDCKIDFVVTEAWHDQLQENSRENGGEHNANGEKEKSVCRNSHHKKAKKMWLHEESNSKTKEFIQDCLPERCNHKEFPGTQAIVECSDSEGEVIPVVVGPGHIRFQHIDGKQCKQQKHDLVGTLQWNGTSSEMKGQQWYQEKISKTIMNKEGVYNEQQHHVAHEGAVVPELEKLPPLTCLPKEGDVVAYQLVKLTSPWSPEFSSFRVGKVSSFDPISMNATLVPVRGYPVFSCKNEERSSEPNPSLYKEDGSLEIDFMSLVDVRIFSNEIPGESTSDTAWKSSTGQVCSSSNWDSASKKLPTSEARPSNNWDLALYRRSSDTVNGTTTPTPVDREKPSGWEGLSSNCDWGFNGRPSCNVNYPKSWTSERKGRDWDKIRGAHNENPELLQENGWRSWESTQPNANLWWCFQVMRGSVPGPTVKRKRAWKDHDKDAPRKLNSHKC